MKKLFPLLILSFTLTQEALAGHHPPVEADDNSVRNFLIGLIAIAVIALVIYFIRKKFK